VALLDATSHGVSVTGAISDRFDNQMTSYVMSPRQPNTGVALLAAAGVDPSEIARRAGHSSVSFTYDPLWPFVPRSRQWRGLKLEALRADGLASIAHR
jgi:hypothetical protein